MAATQQQSSFKTPSIRDVKHKALQFHITEDSLCDHLTKREDESTSSKKIAASNGATT